MDVLTPADVVAPSALTLWRALLPSDDAIRAARRRLHGNAVVIAALIGISYAVLVLSDARVVPRVIAACVLVLALVALATSVMHDANHGAFSSHRWVNRVLAYTSDALGASSYLWRIQHNQLHHGNTNVVGFDADLELAPWARLAPTQPWRPRFRWQHVYIWPLYGFMSLKNLLVSDLLSLVRGRIGDQPLRAPVRARTVCKIVFGKLAHLGWAVVVPLMFNPWWGVLTFYVVCSWLVGFLLATIFQLAHCVDLTEMADPSADRRGNQFEAHQLLTTANVACSVPVVGHLFRWLAGGLDHQIEHHLSPGLPHTAYSDLGAQFKEACRANGITYRLHPGLWPALCSHTRWLRHVGQPTDSELATRNGSTRPGARPQRSKRRPLRQELQP